MRKYGRPPIGALKSLKALFVAAGSVIVYTPPVGVMVCEPLYQASCALVLVAEITAVSVT